MPKFLENIRNWVSELEAKGQADKVLYRFTGGNLTARDMLHEVENNTQLGRNFVDSWKISLANQRKCE